MKKKQERRAEKCVPICDEDHNANLKGSEAMCKGLRTSIADLRVRGLGAKFRAFKEARRCFVTNRTIQEDEDVFVVLVSLGRTIMFRLILAVAEKQINRILQQLIVVEKPAALREVLRIVRTVGVCMGAERDVCSKIFPQKGRTLSPIVLKPPKKQPRMYVSVRQEDQQGLREQRIRPL